MSQHTPGEWTVQGHQRASPAYNAVLQAIAQAEGSAAP